jgi:putative hemolysin
MLSISLVFILILLVCAALISAAEVGLFSLDPKHLEEIRKSKSKKDDLVMNLIAAPKRLIATLLISINFANIGIVILSSYFIRHLFDFSPNPLFGFLFQVVIVTFLLLIAGEVVPKIYASRNPLKTAAMMAYPVYILQRIFTPLSSFMMFTTSFIDEKYRKKGHQISVEELETALELTSTQQESHQNEHKILKGIVRFGNTDVKQIMTPRVDVIALDKASTFKEVIETIVDCGFSRIPVYDETFDNIIGILFIKDLLKHLEEPEDFAWYSLCRQPFYVPETKKIDDLLKEFQTKKIHMAIVVDEYGGSQGIVTFEDIIEEILGDINDEFDEEEAIYSKLDENNYVFEGKIPLNDFYRIINIDGDNIEELKGESDTLAGLIIEMKGRIPKKGEKLMVENLQFTVEAADKRRVKRIKLTLHEKN